MKAWGLRVPDAVQRLLRCSAEPGPICRQASWTPDSAAHHAAEERRAAQHPGNRTQDDGYSKVPMKAWGLRVPDAVQRLLRCSAEPGPICRQASWTPDSAAHHAAEERRAAQHPGNRTQDDGYSKVPMKAWGLRVPDAVQRLLRCSAEPGPICRQARWTPDQQRTTPRKSGALRSIRGTARRMTTTQRRQ